MGLHRNAKPTMGNIRTRLMRLRDTAENLEHLATRWNPKGRYFVPQRDAIKLAQEVHAEADRLLAFIRR